LERLKAGNYLQQMDKGKVPLAGILPPEKPGDPMVLRFARRANDRPVLSLEDKDVTLVLKLGDNAIRT